MGDRRHPEAGSPPGRSAGRPTTPCTHAGPDTPARATTASSSGPRTRRVTGASGTETARSRRPSEPVQISARGQRQGLAQRLRHLEQELVEGDGPREPAAERLEHLVGRLPLAVDQAVGEPGQPLPGRQVEEGGDGRGQHRQPEQRALAVGGGPAQAEDDDQVDADDHAAEAGEGDGVGQQGVDPADEALRRAEGEGDGDRAGWPPPRWRRRRRAIPTGAGRRGRPGSPRRPPPPPSRTTACAGARRRSPAGSGGWTRPGRRRRPRPPSRAIGHSGSDGRWSHRNEPGDGADDVAGDHDHGPADGARPVGQGEQDVHARGRQQGQGQGTGQEGGLDQGGRELAAAGVGPDHGGGQRRRPPR